MRGCAAGNAAAGSASSTTCFGTALARSCGARRATAYARSTVKYTATVERLLSAGRTALCGERCTGALRGTVCGSFPRAHPRRMSAGRPSSAARWRPRAARCAGWSAQRLAPPAARPPRRGAARARGAPWPRPAAGPGSPARAERPLAPHRRAASGAAAPAARTCAGGPAVTQSAAPHA